MTYRNGTFIVERWRFSMDPLLPVVMLFLTWVLSQRYYPDILYLGETYRYWLLGGFTALFITFSIIIHELGHSLAARFFNIPIQRIHLYLFGGMAELKYRPQEPRQEWWIALSGPVASLFLAGTSWLINTLFFSPAYLAWYFLNFATLINFLVALFNLIPIFPLDGGRLLRALLWKKSKNFITASKLTQKTGSIFIAILIVLSLLDMLYLNSGYSLIAGVLALYMLYTFYSGRRELEYNPTPHELIFHTAEPEDFSLFLKEIEQRKPEILKNSILPILTLQGVYHVLEFKEPIELFDAACLEYQKRPIELGDFVDPWNDLTFTAEVRYSAEWVPVLRGTEYYGMCDAREMRFWLQQQQALIY